MSQGVGIPPIHLKRATKKKTKKIAKSLNTK